MRKRWHHVPFEARIRRRSFCSREPTAWRSQPSSRQAKSDFCGDPRDDAGFNIAFGPVGAALGIAERREAGAGDTAARAVQARRDGRRAGGGDRVTARRQECSGGRGCVPSAMLARSVSALRRRRFVSRARVFWAVADERMIAKSETRCDKAPVRTSQVRSDNEQGFERSWALLQRGAR